MKRRRKLPRRIRLVRHARSKANEAMHAAMAAGEESFHIPMADKNAPLVVIGEQQVFDLGSWLATLPPEMQPTRIVSSKYRRACQSEYGISKHFGKRLIRLPADERLNEINWGVLRGLTELGIKNRYPHELAGQKASSFGHRPENGESRRDLIKRLQPAVDDLFTDNEDEDLIVVTHSEVILCLRKMFEGMTEAEAHAMHQRMLIPNCSVTSYVRHGNGLYLEYEYFVAPPVKRR